MKFNQMVEASCIDCKETGKQHAARGLCRNCYMRQYMRSKRNSKTKNPKIKSGKFCRGCGDTDTEKIYSKKLCRSCYASWKRQQKIWRERYESENNMIGTSVTTGRKIVKVVYGSDPFCNRCGQRPHHYGQSNRYTVNPMHIHHINEDRTDNTVKNLEVLCGSCHKKHHVDKILDV